MPTGGHKEGASATAGRELDADERRNNDAHRGRSECGRCHGPPAVAPQSPRWTSSVQPGLHSHVSRIAEKDATDSEILTHFDLTAAILKFTILNFHH